MLITDDFIESLKNDPIPKTIELCDKVASTLSPSGAAWSREDYLILLEAYALLTELIDSELLPLPIYPLDVSGSGDESQCADIYKWVLSVKQSCIGEVSKLRLAGLRNRFRGSLGAAFAYAFSQGDLDRVQVLINQLRELISNTNDLETEHQQRLLRRLEKLQAEMHKKVSDLDRFWGLIGDAGVVMGKLGTDAKPIVDRVHEIAQIVWRTQSRAEELPISTKLPQLKDSASYSGGGA